jgi:hypothetical protein
VREAEIGDVAQANAQLFELIGARHWYMHCPTERESVADTRRPRGCIASGAGTGIRLSPDLLKMWFIGSIVACDWSGISYAASSCLPLST